MLSLATNEHYNLIDSAPELPLDAIEPLSLRAQCLVARRKSAAVLKSHMVHVVGVVEMLAGIDYHAGNFTRVLGETNDAALTSDNRADHEAVAYLNRMGQIHAFVRSAFVRSELPDADARIPTIRRYLIFRNKVAAHRAIDLPRGESIDQLLSYAKSMSFLGGRLYSPRPSAAQPPFPKVPTLTALLDFMISKRAACYLEYQIQDPATGEPLNFSLEREHPLVASETYSVIEALLSRDASASTER